MAAQEDRGFLLDQQAMAAIVLWSSGQFDTREIADLLAVREDAVYRTLHMARSADSKRRAR
jgi:DNA-directed RNA polymerase specialized sigma24 family protein